MRWSRNETDYLFSILERISSHLYPVDGKQILVLCSGTGEMAFWLAEMMETGNVTGLELDPDSLDIARRSTREMGLEGMVTFQPAEKEHIPFPDSTFDALVSEFVVYPTSMTTEIGRPELARVLKPGGKLILTDVIVTKPLPEEVRESLMAIGLDYLYHAHMNDFISGLAEAGFYNIESIDLTPTVRNAWESRRENDLSPSHWMGYSYLMEDNQFGLGKAIFYIYARGEKPRSSPIR